MSNIDGKNKLDLEAAVNEVVINWGKELMLNVNSEMTSLPLLLLKAKKKKKKSKVYEFSKNFVKNIYIRSLTSFHHTDLDRDLNMYRILNIPAEQRQMQTS